MFDDQNIQVPSSSNKGGPTGIHQQKILLQLQAHLNEGAKRLQKLKSQDDVSPADASDFEDAIDLMVNSDLEMTQ